MSDNPKKAEKEMEKAIFISADCWLEVFDLLPPSQLGLGIALISRRFDFYVDEHFKTRKWTLGQIIIQCKIGQNGAEEMEIVNSDEKALPIPQNPLPNKIIGFRGIQIFYFDQNVLTFLHHFHRFFASSTTELFILTENVSILEFFMRNIWPMFNDTIREMYLKPIAFRQIRQFSPSILFDCPSLHFVFFDGGILPEFPPDDSANASDGQAVTKWLFSPHPDNLWKELSIENPPVDQWPSTVKQIKAAFLNASSPVAFGISVSFPPSSSFPAVLPFELTNEFTQEKLALSKEHANVFHLNRCPFVAKKRQQQKIEGLGDRWNRIDFFVGDDGVGEGLLDNLPGPSDH